ncbi:MAG: phage portal protein [Bacteroidaceae bacterium]|nr:phage portal protein [Bacteroidaceae bacterium]
MENQFTSLLHRGDINMALSLMTNDSQRAAEALREYNPACHAINQRQDKPIFDKNGHLKRWVKRWKLPIDYPRYINEIALVFIYGRPVIWRQSSTGTDEAFERFSRLIQRLHFNAKIRECKRLAGAETQAVMLFHPYRNKQGLADCRLRVLAQSKGDDIYTAWDHFGCLHAFAWGYKTLNQVGQTVRHIDFFTDQRIFHCIALEEGWKVTEENNIIGKIPVVVFQQEKEWAGVEALIEREEYIASRNADTNDYFSDPMLILDADIIKNMPDKNDENKTLIKRGGSSEAAASYLTWDNAPENKQKEIEWLQNHILSKTFTPNIDFDNMKSLSNVSGKALKQLMVLADIKAARHKELHDELLDRFASICIALIANVLDVSLKPQCDKLVITHEFQPPFDD